MEIQAVTVGLNNISHQTDIVRGLISQLSFDWLVLAQQINDPDVLGQMRDAWNHFVASGQVWALLIGIALGYIFRNFTAF
ncbi:hypothetical protein [Lyngbya aestuarii]|uniref:hypothetical protein n=1 Tax=Lyngbya aestuarii TaxID=118322 RepID=UPI00403DFABD